MALSFVSATAQTSAGTELTFAAPSGIADDDIIILMLGRAEVSTSPSWGTGFTELFNTAHDGGSFAAAWKRASSESGDYVVSWSGSTAVAGVAYCIRGAITSATPVVAGTTATGSSTTPDPPSTDPGSSAARLAIACFGQEGKLTSSTVPSGYTEPATGSEAFTSGGGSPTAHEGVGTGYRTYTGQAENPGTFDTGNNDGWAANTLVFTPEPGGATATPVLAANSYRQRRV